MWTYGLGALSVLLLLSGVDDCVPLCICLIDKLKRLHKLPGKTEREAGMAGERRIAIFVPCWRESAVIGNMVRHNLAAIRYQNFDFFLGVYPNDPETAREVERLAADFHNVHVARCPNPGPTSKADCLNGIYERMKAFESESGTAFDTILLHDAEDLIHPQALDLINRKRARFDMVQVPVLPLKTGFRDFTHGVYCDEFSEFQTVDMRARELSRSFIPSNGVGTGFARAVLDRLARERNGHVFDVASLTEDYAIGVQIHVDGYRQHFAPLRWEKQDYLATRELFPRTARGAIRQRTRWVTGIALQCWARYGWGSSWRMRYWFWRDRKGLVTNPLSLLANTLFLGGLLDWLGSIVWGYSWHFAIYNQAVRSLCVGTLILQCFRSTVRAICAGRIFGLTMALGTPLRSFVANLINCIAVLRAVHEYFAARRQNRMIVWKKTEHAYPARESLQTYRRHLLEILVGTGMLSEEQVGRIERECELETTLDLLLLNQGLVTEEQMCKALTLQSGLPAARVEISKMNAHILRSLPTHVEKRYRAVPFEVSGGKLLIATASVPEPKVVEEIAKLTELPLEFQLVTRSTYCRLQELLESPAAD